MFTIKRIRWGFPRGSFRAAALACVVSVVSAGPAAAQSLREELRELIRAHPRIEESRAQLREADEIVRQARSGFLPSVSVTGSFGGEMVSNPSTRALNEDNLVLRSNALGVEVRQPLVDGGFAWNDTDAALLRRESGAKALDSVVQEIMLQGVTAYIEILRLSELIRVARARERTIRKQENLETERVERGAGIEVDVLQAKSRLQLAIEARVDLEGQLRTAAARYINVFQRQPDITLMRLVQIPTDLLPATLDEALYVASTENPQLAGLTLLAKAARVNVDVQRAAFFPSIDVVGRWDHESNVGGTRNVTKDMAVLLEMSWEVFAGFRNEATVAASQEFLIQALTATDQGIRDINERVRQSWTKLENTRLRKELLINAVSIAQEVFTARQELRDIGKATSLEVLDAENEVFQAEQNLIRADYDNRVAVYELAFAMGLLSPAMLDLDIEVIEDIDQYLLEPEEVDERPPHEVEETLPTPQGEGDPLVAPLVDPQAESDASSTKDASQLDSTEDTTSSDDQGAPNVIESPPTTVPAQEALQESALPTPPTHGGADQGAGALLSVREAPNDTLLPSLRDNASGEATAGKTKAGTTKAGTTKAGDDGAIVTAGAGAVAQTDPRTASDFAREVRGVLIDEPSLVSVDPSLASSMANSPVSESTRASALAAREVEAPIIEAAPSVPMESADITDSDVISAFAETVVGAVDKPVAKTTSDLPTPAALSTSADLNERSDAKTTTEVGSLTLFSGLFSGSATPKTGARPEEQAAEMRGDPVAAVSASPLSIDQADLETAIVTSPEIHRDAPREKPIGGREVQADHTDAREVPKTGYPNTSKLGAVAFEDPAPSRAATETALTSGTSSAPDQSVPTDVTESSSIDAGMVVPAEPALVSTERNETPIGSVQSAKALQSAPQPAPKTPEEPGIAVNEIDGSASFDVPGSLLFGGVVPPVR